MTSSDDLITITRDGEAATITLQRPAKRNALSIAMRDAISDALDDLADDPTLKAVAFTGAGEVFCAGFDLSEFPIAAEDPGFSRKLWDSSDRYHLRVLTFPLPTVAAVNGPALAGGFDLAIMCDLRIASTTARFAHPEYTFGDVVYAPLRDLVGGAVARELTMTGRSLDAEEALRVHLVNQVVEPAALPGALTALLEQICRAPRENLMRTKAKALAKAGVAPNAATLDL